MSDNGSIRVGVFDDANGPSGHLVPPQYQGKQIWFSTKHNFFVIVDDENKPIKPFDLDKFGQFNEAGVIIFTNPSVQTHMEKLYDEHAETEDLFVSDDEELIEGEDQDDDDIWEEDSYDLNEYEDNWEEDPRMARKDAAAKPADPTRHVVAFFVATFVVTAIAFCVIVFGRPVTEGISKLIT